MIKNFIGEFREENDVYTTIGSNPTEIGSSKLNHFN